MLQLAAATSTNKSLSVFGYQLPILFWSDMLLATREDDSDKLISHPLELLSVDKLVTTLE